MRRIDIPCIFCKKESNRIEWVENGFAGKRCDCGLLYLSPRPELEEILDLYNSYEADASSKSRIQAEFAARLNGRHRLRLLKNYLSQGSLLEIGSGGGYFLDESKRAGFEPFAVELNFLQARFIKEQLRIPVETDPFTESSFAGIYFDIICHFDVVSHFYDPISEFKTFNRRLKDGGILFFETGNGGDLSQRWLKFIGRLQYPQHLFLFSKKNIEQLCTQTGFEIIKLYQYSIFSQLLLIKFLQWVRKRMERFISRRGTGVVSEDLGKIAKKHSWWKVLLSKSVIFLNFFIRYVIGRFLPRFGPQTIIYIAKKVGTVN
jgi:SAM-dependent methyltransferase